MLRVGAGQAVVARLHFIGPFDYANGPFATTANAITVSANVNDVVVFNNEIERFPFLAIGNDWSLDTSGLIIAGNYTHHNGGYQCYLGGQRLGACRTE